jgi:beta-aspartyl-peptidase (threonine type)
MKSMGTFSLLIHGGAGTIRKDKMSPEMEIAYREGLEASLGKGFGVLENGGTAIDAVMAAVRLLEDNILFNAGRGSVYTNDGRQEMDAALMDGKTLMAGAVAAVSNIRNPIDLAYTIMTQSPHVLLHGKGAFDFAVSKGLKTEPDEYFFSQKRLDQLKKAKDKGSVALDHNVELNGKRTGTVGAVACDRFGNLAAATSTGGMTNKEYGRIGDSPLIGAGTYANDKTCAVSCTGHGELFMRTVAAYDVSCLMEYRGLSLKEAVRVVVQEKLVAVNGEGGLIAVDASGDGVMDFNSEGMYRAIKTSSGKEEISIYKD